MHWLLLVYFVSILFLMQIQVIKRSKHCIKRSTRFLLYICDLKREGLFSSKCYSSSPLYFPTTWTYSEYKQQTYSSSCLTLQTYHELKRFAPLNYIDFSTCLHLSIDTNIYHLCVAERTSFKPHSSSDESVRLVIINLPNWEWYHAVNLLTP